MPKEFYSLSELNRKFFNSEELADEDATIGRDSPVRRSMNPSASRAVVLDNDFKAGESIELSNESNDWDVVLSVPNSFPDITHFYYSGVSFSVGSEDLTPTGIQWNNDGSKLYMVGLDSNSIYQYTSTTSFDLSTVSYDSISFNAGSEDTLLRGLVWNNDGTRLFLVGQDSISVHQYTATTPFDLSTVSYDSINLDVSTEDTDPTGILWNDDGSKMYILGDSNNSVFQYTALTPFDLSTVTYDSIFFSVSTEDGLPFEIAWNNDGTKLYVAGNTNIFIFQYTASTPFDISTLSYDGISLDVVDQDSSLTGLTWNSDGTKFYVLGNTNNSIYEYTTNINNLRILHPKQSATFTAIQDNPEKYQDWSFLKPEGFLLSSAVFQVSFDVSGEDSVPSGITWNNDGSKLYMTGEGNDSIYQYTATTPFDLSTVSYDSVSFDASSQDAFITGITWNNDGSKLHLIGGEFDNIYQYSASTPFDLSTVSYDGVSFDISTEDGAPRGIIWNNNGTKLYMVGIVNDSIYQYTATTPFDISTLSYDGVSLDVSTEDTDPRGITWNNDGSKLYMVGESSDSIYQYTATTPFDLSTVSYDGVSLDVSSEDGAPTGIVWNNDGTKLYMAGHNTDSIYQYSTGYLISQP